MITTLFGLHANDSYAPKIKVISIDQSQEQTITGTITDGDGAPLPGANIFEKGTLNGTQTDFDGNFSISVTEENAILKISYIGFATREVPINGQSNISIVLQQSGNLNIRGYTSINGGQPLVLIDGIPGDLGALRLVAMLPFHWS